MSTISLFDALTMIQNGKATQTLDSLSKMRLQSSSDIYANFVYAHALDSCGQLSRAQAIWETANKLQARQRPIKKTAPSNATPEFSYSDQFKSELNKILSEEDSDEIHDLIVQLNAGGRKPLDDDFDVDEEDDLDVDLSEDDFDGANTETYARILVAQKKYSEASEVYRSLSEENTQQKERLLQEAQRLEDLANQQKDR
ncbi:MAG: hypothetical protein OXE59_00055 [Bacteroidetes bacterium]|nr:hypothetical protein [Bacteroidota bacterium]